MKEKPGYLSNGPGEKADEEKRGKEREKKNVVNLTWLPAL